MMVWSSVAVTAALLVTVVAGEAHRPVSLARYRSHSTLYPRPINGFTTTVHQLQEVITSTKFIPQYITKTFLETTTEHITHYKHTITEHETHFKYTKTQYEPSHVTHLQESTITETHYRETVCNGYYGRGEPTRHHLTVTVTEKYESTKTMCPANGW
ncbi:uncharacterized protein LOC121877011 [Homarus americanus]|uniref:Uncharacterized protein n=1 Tax=Homarus americanus TaxID=6706 RepID=A0A8J5JJQ6_HOMAM|nr:uncharacterized protein LOC121877011 [Homarus americanus]KAG7159797.1 hypothetical protein Hamer_G022411 [Homarus americanus]